MFALLLWGAQQPSAAKNQEATSNGKASVSGFVRTRDGQPLNGAHVIIFSTNPHDSPESTPHAKTETGPHGEFHMKAPYAGDYYLGVGFVTDADCSGHVLPPFKARGNILNFGRGEQKSGVVFEVGRGGVLSGTLKNENAQPVPKATVSLYQRVTVGKLKYHWVSVAFYTTDDRGRFGGCNLPGGPYYLGAIGSIKDAPGHPATDAITHEYVETFYPGAAHIENGRPVAIRNGGLTQVELVLHSSPTFHVRGRIVAPQGPAFGQSFVVLTPVKFAASAPLPRVPVQKDGSYDIAGVAPGSYNLEAGLSTSESEKGPWPWLPDAQVHKQWRAHLLVNASAADTHVPDLTLAPCADLQGQLWDDQGKPLGGGVMQFLLDTEDGQYPMRITETGNTIFDTAAYVDAQGKFSFIQFKPGRYRIAGISRMIIKRPLAGDKPIYVASASIGGHDVLQDGFELKPGSVNKLDVVVSTNAGSVHGTASDSQGHGHEDAIVLMVPMGKETSQWHRYYAASSTSDGQFEFSGIAPGDYEIYAFQSPPMNHLVFLYSRGPEGHVNVDDLAYYRPFAQTVHITPGGALEMRLKVIPAQ